MDYDQKIEAILDMGGNFGYDCRIVEHGSENRHLVCVGQCISVHVELRNEGNSLIYLWVRTTSGQLAGERTDANEIISVLLAGFLRLGSMRISCRLWDVAHPIDVPETEVYARYITLDQPGSISSSLDDHGLSNLKELFKQIELFEVTFRCWSECSCTAHLAEQKRGQEPNEDDRQEHVYSTYRGYVETWAEEIARIIGEPLTNDIQFCERKCPSWLHYRSIHTGITIYHVPGIAAITLALACKADLWQLLPVAGNNLYVSLETTNCVPTRLSIRVTTILKKLHQLPKGGQPAFIPMENYFIAIAGDYLVFSKGDCGKKRFDQQKEKIRARHLQEAAILFPILDFIWSDQINDEYFELLILDLIKRENGVSWARKVSSSTERDGGRDMICEWESLPLPGQSLPEEASLLIKRRIIVQCKAYQKPVSKSKVQDIRDTVEEHGGDGYFLAVSSYLTSGLTSHLQKMRDDGKLWIDWWTRSEIEERLKSNLDLVAKYDQILKIHRKNYP